MLVPCEQLAVRLMYNKMQLEPSISVRRTTDRQRRIINEMRLILHLNKVFTRQEVYINGRGRPSETPFFFHLDHIVDPKSMQGIYPSCSILEGVLNHLRSNTSTVKNVLMLSDTVAYYKNSVIQISAPPIGCSIGFIFKEILNFEWQASKIIADSLFWFAVLYSKNIPWRREQLKIRHLSISLFHSGLETVSQIRCRSQNHIPQWRAVTKLAGTIRDEQGFGELIYIANISDDFEDGTVQAIFDLYFGDVAAIRTLSIISVSISYIWHIPIPRRHMYWRKMNFMYKWRRKRCYTRRWLQNLWSFGTRRR